MEIIKREFICIWDFAESIQIFFLRTYFHEMMITLCRICWVSLRSLFLYLHKSVRDSDPISSNLFSENKHDFMPYVWREPPFLKSSCLHKIGERFGCLNKIGSKCYDWYEIQWSFSDMVLALTYGWLSPILSKAGQYHPRLWSSPENPEVEQTEAPRLMPISLK